YEDREDPTDLGARPAKLLDERDQEQAEAVPGDVAKRQDAEDGPDDDPAVEHQTAGGRTNAASSSSSVAAGSLVTPPWTGEVWIIALRGAVSQWKRSGGGRAATGPPSGRPSQTATTVSRCRSIAATSASGASARSRAGSSSMRAAR